MMRYLIMALLLTLAACSENPEGPVKIGAPLSLTGYASSYGENTLRGLELAREEINAGGGVRGRIVEVIYEDDATNGRNAASATHKLIAVDGVSAIIGGTWDLSLEPMVPIAQQEDIILFRTWPAVRYQTDALAQAIAHKNASTIAILRNSGAWGVAHKEGIERIMDDLGGRVVGDFVQTNVDGNDFRTDIAKIKELRPDAVFLAVGSNDAASIMKLLKEQSIDATAFSPDGALGTAIELGLVRIEDAQGACLVDMTPADEKFTRRYVDRYGEEPGLSADTAYDALMLLAGCYETAGTTQTGPVRDCLRESGAFDVNGDATGPVPVYCVDGGQYVRLLE